MTIQDLVMPTRVSITITAIVCAFTFYRSFRENLPRSEDSKMFLKALAFWMFAMGSIAFVFTHTSIFGLPGAYLPMGVVPGFVIAILSLFWKPAQDAFASLSDIQIRNLMAYRTIFGAFLIAGAALGLFPIIFALTAGLGDLLAGWLPALSNKSMSDSQNRPWRWIVHGWGTIDLIDVAVLGTFVVRPWLIEQQSLGPSMLLPWMAVPLLFAVNLHGLRLLVIERREVRSLLS